MTSAVKPLFDPSAPDWPGLMTVKQTAYYLQVCETTVLGLLNSKILREKKIEGYKAKKRHIITQSAIDYANDVKEPAA